MRDLFQVIGAILTIVSAIIGYTYTILRYKSSNRDKCADAWLFEGLIATSAISVFILIIFIGISSLF